MMRTAHIRRIFFAALCAVVAAACTPVFVAGSSVDSTAGPGSTVRLVWTTAIDAEHPAAGHGIATYEIHVDGILVDTVDGETTSCSLAGLAPSTSYAVAVSAVSPSGERSRDAAAGYDAVRTDITTPAGATGGGIAQARCDPEPDTDGDRLPDWAETDTGIYVDKTDTGTDPLDPDTDDDAIDDGDEVTGSVAGLPLPALGADPLRATILIEVDWMDDSADCGPHSHRPSAAAVDRFVQAFAAADHANPDGSTGIDMVVDYGQGSPFNGGRLIPDSIAPIGSINGGVNNAEFQDIKRQRFPRNREGYFHYSVHMHRYATTSGSSGQAELPGDDLIVSLQCFDSLTNTSNTLMHELGHNLSLRHGGFENLNRKPNYNSVMNYRFQFPGVDRETGAGACDSIGDQVLDYARDTRIDLDESALVESAGVCGSPAIDWNTNGATDAAPYALSINADAALDVLRDTDDWSQVDFGAINDFDGAPLTEPEVVDEQPVPSEFRD